jgi:hypothetical protein
MDLFMLQNKILDGILKSSKDMVGPSVGNNAWMLPKNVMSSVKFNNTWMLPKDVMSSLKFNNPWMLPKDVMSSLKFNNPWMLPKDIMSSVKFNNTWMLPKNAMSSVKFNNTWMLPKDVMSSLKYDNTWMLPKDVMKSFNFGMPFNELRNSITKNLSPDFMKDTFELFSEDKWLEIFSNVEEGLSVNPDGSILANSQTYSQNELRDVLNQVTSGITSRINRQDSILELISSEIIKLKDLKIQKIILWILRTFIIGVIINYFTTAVNPFYEGSCSFDKKQVKREINQSVKESFPDKTQLISYRFVISRHLNVHSEKNCKSRTIGVLYFGQVVKLIEKGRHWSLVEWQNKDRSVLIQGWIFSRYVEKFN